MPPKYTSFPLLKAILGYNVHSSFTENMYKIHWKVKPSTALFTKYLLSKNLLFACILEKNHRYLNNIEFHYLFQWLKNSGEPWRIIKLVLMLKLTVKSSLRKYVIWPGPSVNLLRTVKYAKALLGKDTLSIVQTCSQEEQDNSWPRCIFSWLSVRMEALSPRNPSKTDLAFCPFHLAVNSTASWPHSHWWKGPKIAKGAFADNAFV